MLTDVEKDRLANRDKLDNKTRARNEFIARNKLKSWLADSTDALSILKTLEDKPLKKLINDDMVSNVYEISEQMTILSPFEPIIRDQSGEFVYKIVFDPEYPDDPRPYKRKIIREATEEDLIREDRLKKHVRNLLSVMKQSQLRQLLIEMIEDRLKDYTSDLIRQIIWEDLSPKEAERFIKTLQKDLQERMEPNRSWVYPRRYY